MSTIRYQLSAAERSALRDLAGSATGADPGSPPEQRLRDIALLAHEAPAGLRAVLLDLRKRESAASVIIGGLPVDDAALHPTPEHWQHVPLAWTREDVLLLMTGSLLGEPFAWSTQQDGRFVHNVLPIKEHVDEQLGSGTRQTLWWHTEDAFHEARPDYLLLLCLRNPDMVATTYADVSRIDVEPEMFAALSQPQFEIRPDNSHKPQHNSTHRAGLRGDASAAFSSIGRREAEPRRIPVMFGDPQSPYLRLDPYFMRQPGSARHAAAFAWLRERIDASLMRIVLQPGDCLIIDNYRAVHGRDAYEARFDGTDRWLKRVNVSRDLRPSRALRHSAGSATIFG